MTRDLTVGDCANILCIENGSSVSMIQDDIMNQYGLLTIVMPLRPGVKQSPYVVNIKASSLNGLDKDRFIDVGQIEP